MAFTFFDSGRAMTVYLPLECPTCHQSKFVVKFGQTSNQKQRYCCQNDLCNRKTFILKYDAQGRLPSVKKEIIDMLMNGSGTRDTARVLGISPQTITAEIKKKSLRFRPLMQRSCLETILLAHQLKSKELMRLKQMKCGALSKINLINGGFGMQYLMKLAKS